MYEEKAIHRCFYIGGVNQATVPLTCRCVENDNVGNGDVNVNTNVRQR